MADDQYRPGPSRTGLTGPLAHGAVELTDGSEVVGHAFTEPSGGGQLQRWLLYRWLGNRFTIGASARGAAWDLAEWQRLVGITGPEGLWRRDSYYIWAQTDVYDHGAEYPTQYGPMRWDTLPGNAPEPTYPRDARFNPPKQLDGGGKITQGPAYEGFVYAVDGGRLKSGGPMTRSKEYWLLPEGYRPAGSASAPPTAIAPDGRYEHTAHFLEVMRGEGRWQAGGVFITTGCVNYTGHGPPDAP